MTLPIDQADRELAITELDRNVVVTAGAGTGKTALLVGRFLNLLLIQKCPIETLVALTFTEKAAAEIKERLIARLREVADPATRPLVRAALANIAKAQIGTIHSFAAHLLRLFPLEAGVDPAFEVDECPHFQDLLDREWALWLKSELALGSPRQTLWLSVLSRIPLEDIRFLTEKLASFAIPEESVSQPMDVTLVLDAYRQEVETLLATHSGKRKLEEQLWAVSAVLSGPPPPSEGRGNVVLLEEGAANKPSDWTDEDYRRAKRLLRLGKDLIRANSPEGKLVEELTVLLLPFIRRFRKRFLEEGFVSFDGLLLLARDLVKNSKKVREAVKKLYGVFLIDEFQDTDPLQGELLLFLAEQEGSAADRWENVSLAPGRLFVVGDPKQSIYRFRGADIEAFQKITDLILRQGGLLCTLRENFRAHENLTEFTNAVFSRLIQERGFLQPRYEPISSARKPVQPQQTIELWLAKGSKGELRAEDAREAEAAAIAAWIHKITLSSSKGVTHAMVRPAHHDSGVRFCDIALIFRTLTSVAPYLEALRAKGIPFVVEGEKYFYTTSEVLLLANLLRAIENPHDVLAVAALCRSPLGGLPDRELYELRTGQGLFYASPLPASFASKPAMVELWALLGHSHAEAGRRPLGALLENLFQETFLLELAAQSHHAEQAVANMLKFKRLAAHLADAGASTLSELNALLMECITEAREEGESPLAEESVDAVRILSIHKAKGLEYRVVILPNLHGEPASREQDPVLKDWASQAVGVRLPRGACNRAYALLSRKEEGRRQEEELRIFYVAVTRAREKLILCGNADYKKETLLAKLMDVIEKPNGKGSLDLSLKEISPPAKPPVPKPPFAPATPQLHPAGFAETWRRRAERCERVAATPLFLAPSQIKSEQKRHAPDAEEAVVPPDRALLLGSLLHKFLEAWDFTCPKCDFPAKLRIIANGYFSALGLLQEPFPDPKDGTTQFNVKLFSVVEEAQKILAEFINSEPYHEIAESQILGREIPFFYATREGPVMRGSIDILYRHPKEGLVIADYKTDQILDPTRYTAQAQAYTQAITRSIREKPQFKLVFLRPANAITVSRFAGARYNRGGSLM